MESLRARHILLVGTISDDGKVSIDHVAPSPERPRAPRGEGAGAEAGLMVQFLLGDGAIVSRYGLEVQSPCTLPARPGQKPRPAPRLVGGVVPLPAEATALEIVGQGRALARREIPRKGPKVKLGWSPQQAPKGGRSVVKWSASHPERAAMRHTLCVVSGDGQWQPCAAPTEASEVEINLAALPGGGIALGIESTDGFNLARHQSGPSVRPDDECVAVILAPPPGVQRDGQSVLLHGYGYYRGSDRQEDRWLSWSSDVSGELGSFGKRDVRLPAGRHRITLTAGPPGRRSHASVDVDIPGPSGGAPGRGKSRPGGKIQP